MQHAVERKMEQLACKSAGHPRTLAQALRTWSEVFETLLVLVARSVVPPEELARAKRAAAAARAYRPTEATEATVA